MKTFRALILLSTTVLALSACKTIDGLRQDVDSLDLPSALTMNESSAEGLTYDGNCPRVEIVPELRIYSDFTDDSTTKPNNLVSRARIANVQTSCALNERNVTVDLKTTFEGTLGPAARVSSNDKPFFSYPFFIAVAEAGGKVLTKEIYAASITYPPGRTTQAYNENMRLILPMETRDQGRNQKIMLGFQLSPDQLTYSRKLLKAEKEQAEKEAEALKRAQKTQAKLPAGAVELKTPENIIIDARPLEERATQKAQEEATRTLAR